MAQLTRGQLQAVKHVDEVNKQTHSTPGASFISNTWLISSSLKIVAGWLLCVHARCDRDQSEFVVRVFDMDMLAGYGSGSDEPESPKEAATAAAQPQEQGGQQPIQQQQQRGVQLPAAGRGQAAVQLPSPEALFGDVANGQAGLRYVSVCPVLICAWSWPQEGGQQGLLSTWARMQDIILASTNQAFDRHHPFTKGICTLLPCSAASLHLPSGHLQQ